MSRDGFKCVNCGATPALDPGVILEIDHVVPFSKGGEDVDANYRTLCRTCNRGKGNDEGLKSVEIDLFNLVDRINPDILRTVAQQGGARVVANTEEFAELASRNRTVGAFELTVLPNTIMGYHAGANLGIYTLNDHGGPKTNFVISPCG